MIPDKPLDRRNYNQVCLQVWRENYTFHHHVGKIVISLLGCGFAPHKSCNQGTHSARQKTHSVHKKGKKRDLIMMRATYTTFLLGWHAPEFHLSGDSAKKGDTRRESFVHSEKDRGRSPTVKVSRHFRREAYFFHSKISFFPNILAN